MKHFLLRALGIWTLKTVVYAAFTLASILFLIESVPPAVMAAAYYFISFLLAFLFSEWIFLRGRTDMRRLIAIIFATFVWDTVLSLAFSVWLLGAYRYPAPWTQYLVFFIIHAGAMSFAYYARKRFAAVAGLAEGLES